MVGIGGLIRIPGKDICKDIELNPTNLASQ